MKQKMMTLRNLSVLPRISLRSLVSQSRPRTKKKKKKKKTRRKKKKRKLRKKTKKKDGPHLPRESKHPTQNLPRGVNLNVGVPKGNRGGSL